MLCSKFVFCLFLMSFCKENPYKGSCGTFHYNSVLFNFFSFQEILGIAFNRIMRIDPTSREALKTWRYSVMKAWNVNWETREMVVQCEGETITFACTSADIKVIHEFIGGYIFMSMRKDVNQPSNEELFFKLTGGWV